jgi:hypothetical protein
MAFEVYDRKNLHTAPSKLDPVGTIRSNGDLTISPEAYELMGEPKQVELLYDPQNKIVGMRESEEYHAYRVARTTCGWKLISMKSMLKFYGITVTESTRYNITVRDGVAQINLRKPIKVVSRRVKVED